MPRLTQFLRDNNELILMEWEEFARSLPIGRTMDVATLRDHAAQMLAVIATDLDTPQTAAEQHRKAHGRADADRRVTLTAAQKHGAGRADSGFSVAQMVSEFRALRASVTRLWLAAQRDAEVNDIDDLVRFNEAIDQAIAESITRYSGEIGQSKERFLAILGHDLRTPLGAIITSTKFMLDTGELPEPHRTLVARIESIANRMNQMVEDLLDFARTRFGDSIPVMRVEADLSNILNDVAAETGTSHPHLSIQIKTNGDLRGEWDPARLTQVFANLVSNAVQHGGANAPITISAHGASERVRVSVHNGGPLIPKERLPRLFDGMATARRAGAREKGHLGLGLYIVERIVRAHGGSIDVTSSKNEGTTFLVSLPRRPPS